MKAQPVPVSREAIPPRHPVSVTAKEVVSSLQSRVVVDGFRIVIDLVKSRGSRLVDAATGRSMLDFYSFFASMPIGYNHPRFSEPEVREELLDAARTKVANCDVYSVPYARFVHTLHRVMGLSPLERYFFIDGGALAVENALKAAMDWKVRKNLAEGKGERGTEILHFEKAFHGRTGYTLSITNTEPNKTNYFAKFPWPRVAAAAVDYALPEADREKDAASREQISLHHVETILRRKGDDIAGIIIEPIQGEGGDNHFRGEFLRGLRTLCDRYSVLLIFDEVQTGMGLTGKNWCCEHFDVRPDLLAFGKKSQVCGVMAGPRLDEVEDNCFRLSGRISSTWGGNLTDMVRSTHCLEIIEEENLVENARAMGVRFLEGLLQIQGEFSFITAARGRGLMTAFDLPDGERRDAFWKGLYDNNLLAIRCGPRSVRFRPVLDVREEEIDEALDAVRQQCRRMEKSAPAAASR